MANCHDLFQTFDGDISIDVNKKKRIIKKPLKCKSSSKEGHFQQFAFSAVKEATGIWCSMLKTIVHGY